jgi:nicotinate-nucleotide pyrophosphorylase (carboxylating)
MALSCFVPASLTPPPDAVLREAAARALAEDQGPLDVTSTAVIPADARAKARIFTKEACVLAGLPVAVQVFRELDVAVVTQPRAQDGDSLQAGASVLELEGPARPILTGERSALNFLQFLSGIATQTRRFVQAASGTACRILDTRKTVPGLRLLSKYAVRCGGGWNHRLGLYDAFMLKDNHLHLAGMEHLEQAVRRARAFDPEVPLICEADTLEQAGRLASIPVGHLLLDNMSTPVLREAVRLVAGRCTVEASGNMTLERIPEVAASGVDFISVGALTHSVRAIDFSLEILS